MYTFYSQPVLSSDVLEEVALSDNVTFVVVAGMTKLTQFDTTFLI